MADELTEDDDIEPEQKVAELLKAEVVFLNDHWWKKDWPEDARNAFSVNVNCNDVFAWGCSDAEGMTYHDVDAVYAAYKADPDWGPIIWCMRKRNMQPQSPLVKRMKEMGKWTDELQALPENGYDAAMRAHFAKKNAGHAT